MTLAVLDKDGSPVTIKTLSDASFGAGATDAGTQRSATASDSPEIALLGAVAETAPATDTASSGHNGRLQRIAQRLTSLITFFGAQADAANTATDTTAVSPQSVWKQISASVQIIAGAIGSSKLAVKSAANDFADGAIVTLGLKADAKSAATDTTSITIMSVAKQISASVQAIATSIAGTLTVATHAVTGSGNFASTVADGGNVTLGAKADAKSTATDATAITAMSVWKQISASVQAIATSIAGTLTVATHAVTGSGNFASTVADGANVTIGAKADAKSTATDTTAITAMSVWKQISASVQALAAIITSGKIPVDIASLSGGLPPAQATSDNSSPVTLPSDRLNSIVFALTMSTDTSAYTAGDLLADTQQAASFFNKTNGAGVLQSLTVIDEDDQGAALTVYFLKANNTLGTENSAPSISDANARDILGFVDIATADYKDLGGVRVANIKNIGLPIKAVTSTSDIYVAIVNGAGTPTFTASGLKLLIGALLD